jgi:hypothetical protein
MPERRRKTRPLSEQLLEAAARVDEMPRDDLARLLMKAAVRLRVLADTGAPLEHVPVYAYHLLRRLSQAPVPLSILYGQDDESAVTFLHSRALATTSADGKFLTITAAGEALGEIADERQPPLAPGLSSSRPDW